MMLNHHRAAGYRAIEITGLADRFQRVSSLGAALIDLAHDYGETARPARNRKSLEGVSEETDARPRSSGRRATPATERS
ncbi:hypothetical protein [Nocardia sp. NPDC059691]|uniref:hypothetical protein n=1 Tax=Nocardia sp. NPDC059691 TaxID=3346908 RepID=UPI0036BB1D8D